MTRPPVFVVLEPFAVHDRVRGMQLGPHRTDVALRLTNNITDTAGVVKIIA